MAMAAVKGSDGVSFLFLHGVERMYSHPINGPSAGTRVTLDANISINSGYGGGPTVPDDPWEHPRESRVPVRMLIGVGVAGAVLVVAVAIWIVCCVRRRRRQRRRVAQVQPVLDEDVQS